MLMVIGTEVIADRRPRKAPNAKLSRRNRRVCGSLSEYCSGKIVTPSVMGHKIEAVDFPPLHEIVEWLDSSHCR